jgi:predicted transglutaminase-like cysteine proteinase
VEINANQMTVLRSTNDAVNRAIRPKSDAAGKGSGFGDDWELMPASGDCEDYAISKRHRLIAEGWPVRSLRLAVVKTAWGEGHAVLVVKTNEGDLVLDNLTSEIKPFQRSGLRFLKIQSEDNPRMWLAL